MKANIVGSILKDDRVLRVGIGRQFTNVDDALDAVAGIGFKSQGALSGTITSVAGSASITGSGFNDMDPNDYITISGNDEPVKSIESDNAATLWSGARVAVTGVGATIKKLNPYKIVLYGSHVINGSRPILNGIDLRIVGAPTTGAKLSSVTNLSAIQTPINHSGHILFEDFENFRDNVNSTGTILTGAVGSGRTIFHARGIDVTDAEPLIAFHAAALTWENSVCKNARWLTGADYVLFKDITNTSDTQTSDQLLFNTVMDTDTGHDVTFDNFDMFNNAPTAGGQNGGMEWNGTFTNKVFNVLNSQWIQTKTVLNLAAPATMFWTGSGGGTYNFTDCIFESNDYPYEINNRGDGSETFNFVRTTRSDLVSLPRIETS